MLGRIRLQQPGNLRHQRVVCQAHAVQVSLATDTRGKGAGSALVAPSATHPDSDPSTTSTQKAAPSRWSTRDSTGSAGCPGRCCRCCSRCSGRSSSRTGPARARQPLGEAAGAAAGRGRGGPCGRGDSCEEGVRCGGDLGRLERVVGREVDVQEEDASLVRRVFLRGRARDV